MHSPRESARTSLLSIPSKPLSIPSASLPVTQFFSSPALFTKQVARRHATQLALCYGLRWGNTQVNGAAPKIGQGSRPKEGRPRHHPRSSLAPHPSPLSPPFLIAKRKTRNSANSPLFSNLHFSNREKSCFHQFRLALLFAAFQPHRLAKLQRTLIYGNGINSSRKLLKTKDRAHA